MKTFVCTSCRRSVTVGHPTALLRRQARLLARDAYTVAQRLLHGRRILLKLVNAMEERYYLEPHRYRALPAACPHCGHGGQGEARWWSPGLAHRA